MIQIRQFSSDHLEISIWLFRIWCKSLHNICISRFGSLIQQINVFLIRLQFMFEVGVHSATPHFRLFLLPYSLYFLLSKYYNYVCCYITQQWTYTQLNKFNEFIKRKKFTCIGSNGWCTSKWKQTNLLYYKHKKCTKSDNNTCWIRSNEKSIFHVMLRVHFQISRKKKQRRKLPRWTKQNPSTVRVSV